MGPTFQRFTVTFEYPVYFSRGVLALGNRDLLDALVRPSGSGPQRCLFVVEERVQELWPSLLAQIEGYVAHHAEALALAGPTLVIPGAEACKNDPQALPHLHQYFERAHLDRHATVVIVGGGALQDLVGYAAATTHRGVRVVRVPTTVLSQSDSAVGVKNGINAFGKKNFLGTFAAPFAVVNDLDFLRTLPKRDAIAGMAEAVKVALIKDRVFFEWLEGHADQLARLEPEPVAHLVRRCAELHLEHIATAGDPFEYGSARPLDFGHWAAHKLESMTAHRLSHGEAVAIGLALDTRYSAEAGMIGLHDAERVLRLLERIGLPLWDEALDQKGSHGLELLRGLEEFREHLGGELTVTLLEQLGRGREVHVLEVPLIRECIGFLRARAGQPARSGCVVEHCA